MKRREFITLLGGAAATWPLNARGQQAAKIPRIGIIDDAPMWDAFRQGLRDLGYLDDQTIAIEYRIAEGKPDRLAAAAAELVRLPVAVIVTFGTPPTAAAKQATTMIPIVMIGIGDPVQAGFAQASPGRAGISPGTQSLARRWPQNGCSFSRRLFPPSRAWLFFGIPIMPPIHHISKSCKLRHRHWA